MIKDFEGIAQALFFDNIFEELLKKDNIEEEITKISKCINELYNDRRTNNPYKVVEQYIAKYEACIQKQNNIANTTIYRQPQIAVNAVNALPSVVIPPLVIPPLVIQQQVPSQTSSQIQKPITIPKGTQPTNSAITNETEKQNIKKLYNSIKITLPLPKNTKKTNYCYQ
jgi:hypothetical protein